MFSAATDDAPEEYELETVVAHKGEYIHYDTTYLTEPAARRLLVDCVHTLATDGEKPGEIVPEAFLERLEAVTDEILKENKTMTDGVAPRADVVNRIRDEFGLETVP